jgi:hypothetical protein
MGREPPSRQRRVALTGIDVHLFISIFTLTMDDVLAVKRVVLVEWLLCSKAVGIDGD